MAQRVDTCRGDVCFWSTARRTRLFPTQSSRFQSGQPLLRCENDPGGCRSPDNRCWPACRCTGDELIALLDVTADKTISSTPRQSGVPHAANATELRMLRPGPAAGFGGRHDLLVRVHLLCGVRQHDAGRKVPELRRRPDAASHPRRALVGEEPGFDAAGAQAGWLPESQLIRMPSQATASGLTG